VRQLLLTRVNLRLSLSLGSAYAQHLLSLPVRFFDSHQSGELLARFADAPKVSAALSGPILAVALDLLLLFICGSFMFWYSASLTCLTMGFVPAYAVITLWASAAVRHRERRIREAFGALSNLFVELMANIRIVKAYTVEGVANEQLAVAHDTMQRAVMDRATLNIGLVAASTLLSGVTSVALLWVGAGLVMERQLTVGQLMFFFSASTLFMASVDRLGASVAAIQEAAIGLERVNDVRALPQEHEGALLGFGASDRCESIEFRNVGFGYRPNRMVLHDINLRIRAGMTVAVLGETGSGKSSLVSLVNGLYQPQQGQVLVNGRDVRDIDKVALRRRMAVVVQEPGLMSGTIRQNIGLGSTGSDEQVEKAARLACADKFIRDLPGGYDYEVGLAGVGLSCGQRQRIAIARALFRDPAVLILDEATSNLDPETERDVVDALDLGSAARMTIIATHRIAIAARAHHVIVLDDGRIVESGSHAQLLTQKGKYHAMWSTLTPMIGAPSCVE
jgi:ATP-binding cassette subfamily B protein